MNKKDHAQTTPINQDLQTEPANWLQKFEGKAFWGLICLQKLCQEKNISYSFLQNDPTFIQVHLAKQTFSFIQNTLPLNSSQTSLLCQDKDYTYKLLSQHLKMPLTQSFIDPNLNWPDSWSDLEVILNHIENNFNYPLIIKPNRGSVGKLVRACHNRKETKEALQNIFAPTPDYDRLALVQPQISIKKELRVIWLLGQIQFIYEKKFQQATFFGNLSPLHWRGATAPLTCDLRLQTKLQTWLQPALKTLNLQYGGLDIIQDHQDNFWLLEINSRPMFTHFITHNGPQKVQELYHRTITFLEQQTLGP